MIDLVTIHPAIYLFITAIISSYLHKNLFKAIIFIGCLLSLISIWHFNEISIINLTISNYDFSIGDPWPFARLFNTAFLISLLCSTLFCLGQNNQFSRIEIIVSFVHVAAALLILSAQNYFWLFICYESMAISAGILIFCSTKKQAKKIGIRYILTHIVAGLLILIGIAIVVNTNSDFIIRQFKINYQSLFDLKNNLGPILIMIGILINAGCYPCSFWVAESYAVTSPTVSVILISYTTKVSVFLLINQFAGSSVLIVFGIIMIFYGIIHAIIENDIRRLLSYSLVNQVGFMITAIGIGTNLAIVGAAVHAFCHICYKALLMMSASSVIITTNKEKCSDLGAIAKQMPYTTFVSVIGALTVLGFPLTSGFISKSLIIQAASDYNQIIWLLLVIGSWATFLHAGIKFPWFVFFQKKSSIQAQDPNNIMKLPMLIMALICLLIGIYPEVLDGLINFNIDYNYYSFAHLFGQLLLLSCSIIGFLISLPLLEKAINFNLSFSFLTSLKQKEIKLTNLAKRIDHIINKITTQSINLLAKVVEFKLNSLYLVMLFLLILLIMVIK